MSPQFIDGLIRDTTQQPVDYDSEMYKYYKNLIDTREIPADLKMPFWAFVDKEAVLTNLTPQDIIKVGLDFDINYIMYLMATPNSEFTFEQMAKIEQLRAHLNLRLHRAILGFERKMESTQIREVNLMREGGSGNPLAGFLGLMKPKEQSQGGFR
jgi:hypothetical protein